MRDREPRTLDIPLLTAQVQFKYNLGLDHGGLSQASACVDMHGYCYMPDDAHGDLFLQRIMPPDETGIFIAHSVSIRVMAAFSRNTFLLLCLLLLTHLLYSCDHCCYDHEPFTN